MTTSFEAYVLPLMQRAVTDGVDPVIAAANLATQDPTVMHWGAGASEVFWLWWDSLPEVTRISAPPSDSEVVQ